MSKGKYWSDSERSTLKYLFEMGYEDDKISEIMKRPEDGIRGERGRLGLYRRRIVKTPVKIESSISPPKHSDNLPDVSELLVKNNQILTRIEVVLTSTMHKQQDVCRVQEATYALLLGLKNGKKVDTPDKS